jgi:hypothetical protein
MMTSSCFDRSFSVKNASQLRWRFCWREEKLSPVFVRKAGDKVVNRLGANVDK